MKHFSYVFSLNQFCCDVSVRTKILNQKLLHLHINKYFILIIIL